ncbi:MAG TPA: ATP-binding protein [Anaerolineae bacterium]|nr:ATP-binding protein [Anaerolineae bacterium]
MNPALPVDDAPAPPSAVLSPLVAGQRERELQQRDWLLRVAQAISQPLDLREVLERVVRAAVSMTGGHAGAIALRQPSGEVGLVASVRLDARFEAYLAHLEDGPAVAPADADAAPVADPPTAAQRQSPAPWGDRPAPLARNLRSGGADGIGVENLPGEPGDGQQVISLPLEIGQEAIGRIIVFRSEGAAAFTPLDTQLLATFADQAAVAIQNADSHQRLQARERRLASIYDNSPAGVLLLDGTGRVRSHNPAVAQLLGLVGQDLAGRPASELIDLSDLQDRPLPFRLPEGGATASLQGRVQLPRGGAGAWVLVTVTPLPEPRPRRGGFVVDIVDLSGFKEAEDAGRAFLAGLSHELKTPLALIRGYAETLRYEQVRADEALHAEAVDVILDETTHLTRMVEQLLAAARLEAGALRLNLHLLDLGREIARWVEPFKVTGGDRRWELQLDPGLPPVQADPVRLRELLQNLWSNAVKHAPPGSTIRVGARSAADGVAVWVRDAGAGIDPQEQERIFQRFTRASEGGDGAGLGLYMARAIAQAHGGRLDVASAPGQGSTFTLWLPAAAAPPAATSTQPANDIPPPHSPEGQP